MDAFLMPARLFDRVSHDTLFSILEKRGVPHLLLHSLWSWHKSQSCAVNGMLVCLNPLRLQN